MKHSASHPLIAYMLLGLFVLALILQFASQLFSHPLLPVTASVVLLFGILILVHRSKIFHDGRWVWISYDEDVHISRKPEKPTKKRK